MLNQKFYDLFYKPENSVKRESILINKLLFDIQLAHATEGRYLKVYRTDVDNNGYDLVLDSEDHSRKIRVKSKMVDSSTKNWSITKGIICPDFHNISKLPTWSSLTPGVQGGVVLQEVKLLENDIQITYYYTDLIILTIYLYKIHGNKNNHEASKRIINQLGQGNFHDKITLSQACFLKAKSPKALVDVLGFSYERISSKLLYRLEHRFKQEGARDYLGPQSFTDSKIANQLREISEL